MHIACAANSSYLPHAAAMLHSVLCHHKKASTHVHFLHDEYMPDDEIARLRQLVVENGGHWNAHSIRRKQVDNFPMNWRFSREAWYRAFLPEVLPNISRVIYLDADTIVMGALEELWSIDLGNNIVGAVANPLYKFMDKTFIADLQLGSNSNYFNSGVLVLNLDRWRENAITQKLLDFVNLHGSAQAWPDQNALNAILNGRWLRLAPKWNVQNSYFDLKPAQLLYPVEQVLEARHEPKIMHFISPYKPWDYLCKHPYRSKYFEHLAATPWHDSVPIRGVTWYKRILRLLPQPFMWISIARLRRRWRTLLAYLR